MKGPLASCTYPFALAFTFLLLTGAAAQAAPILTSPTTSNLSANQATLTLQATATGTGYFTLLSGSGTACGTGTQVKNGQDSTGAAAFRFGSLQLTANAPGSYTVRNLVQSSNYTVCFTADDGATLQATPASANLTTTAAIDLTISAWTTVGSTFSPDTIDFISLAFAPDGTPYAAFNDGFNEGKTIVKKFNGASWVTVGSARFSASSANYLSMAFAPDGTPYVTYRDGGNGSKATVKKYDGATWVDVGTAGFSAGTCAYTSLVFAPDGTPYVAYMDLGYSKATVMKYNGAAWVNVGSPGFSADIANYTSLAIAPDGMPYVAYQDNANGSKATVKKFDGASWVDVGIAGFSSEAAANTSLAIASDGTPYVAYRDLTSMKATVMKYNGAMWTTVGGAGLSAGQADGISLAISPSGAPCVAYRDNANGGKATVRKFDGAAWVDLGSAGFTTGIAGTGLSLSFAPDGEPYVGYGDQSNYYKATVMKLAPTYTITYDSSSFTVVANSDTFLYFWGAFPVGDGSMYLLFGAGELSTATIYNVWDIDPLVNYIHLGNVVQITSPSGNLLTRTGYTLTGWNTAADGSGTSYPASFSAAFLAEVNSTLYAQWTINTYTVTFDLAGGTRTGGGELSQTIAYGQAATAPTFTAPAGKVFSGWNTAIDNITGPTTATAQYVDYTLPVSAADSYDIHLGQVLSVAAPGVLGNDSDADGQTLTAVLVWSPAHASAFTLNDDGSFSYNHDGTNTGNDSFTYRVSDGTSQSAVVTVALYTSSEAGKNLSVKPSNHLFGVETLSDCAASTAVPFTIRNTGTDNRTLGTLAFGGNDALQFAFGTDTCSGSTLAAGGECTVQVKFCPTTVGSKSATLRIPSDDSVTPVLGALLHNHESPREEAQRRLPPVLYAVDIPATLTAGQTYTLTWSLLGYDDDYLSNVAFFNCAGVAAGTCGNSYGGNFAASGNIAPLGSVAGDWNYNGVPSKVYNYSYTFTAPIVGVNTDIVIRFYHKGAADQAAGNGGLSLLIPGNLSTSYYDNQGRRIVVTVTP